MKKRIAIFFGLRKNPSPVSNENSLPITSLGRKRAFKCFVTHRIIFSFNWLFQTKHIFSIALSGTRVFIDVGKRKRKQRLLFDGKRSGGGNCLRFRFRSVRPSLLLCATSIAACLRFRPRRRFGSDRQRQINWYRMLPTVSYRAPNLIRTGLAMSKTSRRLKAIKLMKKKGAEARQGELAKRNCRAERRGAKDKRKRQFYLKSKRRSKWKVKIFKCN